MHINQIDLKHLRYFVCVAEELHFGRAARRLNMSQPPLSQQIMALEDNLGVMLFKRTQRHVELTPAGEYLLPEARRLLHDMRRIAQQTKEAESGLIGHLRIGQNFSSPFHPFTTQLLHEFYKTYPYIKVELVLHEKSNLLQLLDLKTAHLDAALIWLDDSHSEPDITRLDLAKDPLDVVVPSNHPLAKQDKIHIRDLVGLPFISQPRHAGTQRYEGIFKAFATISESPKVMHEALQMPLVMNMVAAGQGVSLLPSFLGEIPMTGVVFRPLVMPRGKAPTMTYNLIVPQNFKNPATRHFVQTARRLIRS
jgi:DNA-binding transcriptional LysR family regulator